MDVESPVQDMAAHDVVEVSDSDAEESDAAEKLSDEGTGGGADPESLFGEMSDEYFHEMLDRCMHLCQLCIKRSFLITVDIVFNSCRSAIITNCS